MNRNALGLVAAISVAACPAGATVYTDRAAFLAALSGTPSVETFAGLVGTPGYPTYIPNGSYKHDGYTLKGVAYRSANTYLYDPGAEYNPFPSSIGMFEHGGGNFVMLDPTTAFGLDFGSYYPSSYTVTVNRIGGPPLTSTLVTPLSGTSFFGFADGSPIGSVTVRDLSGGDYFRYDNVTVGTVGGVPEPANWALLIAGLGLTGARMRRSARRRQHRSMGRAHG